jgi:Cdc6-like AAA superfamily ATPase
MIWNKVINLIKEIHFKRYSQEEIREIIDEIVIAVWSAESEKINKGEKNECNK